MSATATRVDNLAQGVRENNAVFVDVIRDGNERIYRMNRIFIDEAERTQEERIGLFQQWLSGPLDVSGLNGAIFDTLNRRMRRRVEIARTMADDLRDQASGTRSIWERVTAANRQTARAVGSTGKAAAAAAAKEASDVAEGFSDATGRAARNLRRQSAENHRQN
jgi:hypothetical protein